MTLRQALMHGKWQRPARWRTDATRAHLPQFGAATPAFPRSSGRHSRSTSSHHTPTKARDIYGDQYESAPGRGQREIGPDSSPRAGTRVGARESRRTYVGEPVMAGGVWQIGKAFRFEATRRLADGKDDGNSFTAVAVMLTHALDPVGFVIDFGRLAPLKAHIETVLDHRLLNDTVPDVSDEGIGAYLARWGREHLPKDIGAVLQRVEVRTGRSVPPAQDAAVEFGATHWLEGLPSGHPCGRRHGHTYLVTAHTGADIRQVALPETLARHIAESLAGRVLNDVLPFNPTSEQLAAYLARWAQHQIAGPAGCRTAIRISETETSWAQFALELQ